MARALIFGISGQDGSYLAELLLAKNYEVFGVCRRTSGNSLERIAHIVPDITLYEADLVDEMSLLRVLRDVHPHEVYNLAAMSCVHTSFNQPIATAEYNAIGVLKLLESIKCLARPSVKFYQASTSEMFGRVVETPQCEETPFHPASPYGVSKLHAHWTVRYYREAYRMFACSGILFNHESPRRGTEFVTRKITQAVARIKYGRQDYLELGNLDAIRDWGYAGDYVKAMHLMLQQREPQDFVIATGEAHTVRQFCKLAFEYVGLDYQEYVNSAQSFYRPNEVETLRGDPTKARHILKWEPSVSLDQLVAMMVQADLKREEMIKYEN